MVQTNHKPIETILRKRIHGSSTIKITSYDPEIEWPEISSPRKKQVLPHILNCASLDAVPLKEDAMQVNMLEIVSIAEQKSAKLQQNTANELHGLYAIIQAG